MQPEDVSCGDDEIRTTLRCDRLEWSIEIKTHAHYQWARYVYDEISPLADRELETRIRDKGKRYRAPREVSAILVASYRMSSKRVSATICPFNRTPLNLRKRRSSLLRTSHWKTYTDTWRNLQLSWSMRNYHGLFLWVESRSDPGVDRRGMRHVLPHRSS